MNLKWTKNPPTVSGWYFVKTKSYSTDVWYLVVRSNGNIERDYGACGAARPFRAKHFWFAGPIAPPEDGNDPSPV